MLGGDSHKKKKRHSDDYYYRGEGLYSWKVMSRWRAIRKKKRYLFSSQTTRAQLHLFIRKSTSLQNALHLFIPRHRHIRQIQRWASFRPLPLPLPQAQTPVLICTRNPPTRPSPRTPPKSGSVRAGAAGASKEATPSHTPSPCPLPPRSTRHHLQSRLSFMAEFPKKSL